VALTTPVPQIQLALNGKVEFIKQTTPEFVQAEQKRQAENPDPQTLQEKIKTSLGALAKASPKRHSRKKRDQKSETDCRDN